MASSPQFSTPSANCCRFCNFLYDNDNVGFAHLNVFHVSEFAQHLRKKTLQTLFPRADPLFFEILYTCDDSWYTDPAQNNSQSNVSGIKEQGLESGHEDSEMDDQGRTTGTGIAVAPETRPSHLGPATNSRRSFESEVSQPRISLMGQKRSAGSSSCPKLYSMITLPSAEGHDQEKFSIDTGNQEIRNQLIPADIGIGNHQFENPGSVLGFMASQTSTSHAIMHRMRKSSDAEKARTKTQTAEIAEKFKSSNLRKKRRADIEISNVISTSDDQKSPGSDVRVLLHGSHANQPISGISPADSPEDTHISPPINTVEHQSITNQIQKAPEGINWQQMFSAITLDDNEYVGRQTESDFWKSSEIQVDRPQISVDQRPISGSRLHSNGPVRSDIAVLSGSRSGSNLFSSLPGTQIRTSTRTPVRKIIARPRKSQKKQTQQISPSIASLSETIQGNSERPNTAVVQSQLSNDQIMHSSNGFSTTSRQQPIDRSAESRVPQKSNSDFSPYLFTASGDYVSKSRADPRFLTKLRALNLIARKGRPEIGSQRNSTSAQNSGIGSTVSGSEFNFERPERGLNPRTERLMPKNLNSNQMIPVDQRQQISDVITISSPITSQYGNQRPVETALHFASSTADNNSSLKIWVPNSHGSAEQAPCYLLNTQGSTRSNSTIDSSMISALETYTTALSGAAHWPVDPRDAAKARPATVCAMEQMVATNRQKTLEIIRNVKCQLASGNRSIDCEGLLISGAKKRRISSRYQFQTAVPETGAPKIQPIDSRMSANSKSSASNQISSLVQIRPADSSERNSILIIPVEYQQPQEKIQEFPNLNNRGHGMYYSGLKLPTRTGESQDRSLPIRSNSSISSSIPGSNATFESQQIEPPVYGQQRTSAPNLVSVVSPEQHAEINNQQNWNNDFYADSRKDWTDYRKSADTAPRYGTVAYDQIRSIISDPAVAGINLQPGIDYASPAGIFQKSVSIPLDKSKPPRKHPRSVDRSNRSRHEIDFPTRLPHIYRKTSLASRPDLANVPVSCTVCHSIHENYLAATEHEVTTHMDRRLLRCGISRCSHRAPSKDDLLNHLIVFHVACQKNQVLLSCRFCLRQFKSMEAYVQHTWDEYCTMRRIQYERIASQSVKKGRNICP